MATARRRTVLGIAIAFLYLYSFPYFEGIRSANELPRVYLTMAMVDEGRFAIDTGVRRWGKTVDVSPAGGHYYSNKAPGSSMLAIPAYAALRGVKALGGGEPSLAEMTWTFRVWTGVIPTLLFLLLLWRFLRRYVDADHSREAAVIAYGLGTMAMTYSILFIAHQLSAVLIGAAFIWSVEVVEDERGDRWLFALGLAAGSAVLCDYQAAFAGIPLAIYLTWHLLRSDGGVRRVAIAAAGAAIPIAVLLIYHQLAFGGPFTTGYHASETFAHFHQRGFLGLDRFRWEALVGSTVAPDNGLLFFSPFLVLAFRGWWRLGQQRRWWIVGVTAGVVLIYVAFISSIAFWRGGWQLGPRYVTAMLPFAMVPVAAGISDLEGRWWGRGIVWGLIAVSLVVYVTSAAQFPHFPEKFKNPLFELTFRLWGDGLAPYSAGWLIGLRGFWSLLPVVAALGTVLALGAVPTRRHWRSGALALVVAAGILVIYSTLEGGGGAGRPGLRVRQVGVPVIHRRR